MCEPLYWPESLPGTLIPEPDIPLSLICLCAAVIILGTSYFCGSPRAVFVKEEGEAIGVRDSALRRRLVTADNIVHV